MTTEQEPIVQTVTQETVEEAINGKDYAFLFMTTEEVDKVTEASVNFEKAAGAIKKRIPEGSSAVFLRMVPPGAVGIIPTKLLSKRRGWQGKICYHPLATKVMTQCMRKGCGL